MLRVGLSGGIGSGKSTVARRLADNGAVLIDADVLARDVVAPGSPGLAEVVERFGSGVLDADGALDRPAMARRIFGDEAARAELNSIVHPKVRTRTAELLDQAPGDAIVVHDVPLLVEAGYGPDYHLVVIVDAPEEERVRRLVGRGLEESDARARMRSQATREQRLAAADVWLDNGGAVDDVHAAVDALWTDRLVPFESNIRSRRPAPEHGSGLTGPDPDWPHQADRLMARLRRAAGDRVPRIDHIGSTSVPGLPAEDVLDLQLTVSSMADAEELAEPLADAGFPVVRGAEQDAAHAGVPDPSRTDNRLHAAADPGRRADLYVRVAGSESWRLALLLRDWLRSEPVAREDYLRIKRAAAARATYDGCTDAEERWFAEAVPRAEAWARRVGWTP